MDHPLLSALFEEDERKPVSVSELNADIKAVLERSFSSVWVEGEITGFKAHTSGHWYFSLSDVGGTIKAVCFRGQNFRIRFKPSNGMQVRVRGRVTTYEARGEYQIIVDSLEPVGEGALAVAIEQIKARLQAEGLFDQALKRPLPMFPRRVGVVTSPTGAALHDILNVLERRAKSVHVVIIPTQVQGEFAGSQIAQAIALANEYCDGCLEDEKIDVLIVGRGGGSAEDLWAFNEEQVARAIRASKIPVISAVGHEVDFTIADMAADLRAATPSAAAEIVAKAEQEICEKIDRRYGELQRLMDLRMMGWQNAVQSLAMSHALSRFPARITENRYRLNEMLSRGEDAVDAAILTQDERLRSLKERLAPVSLAKKIGEQKRRLGTLGHRAFAVGADLLGRRDRRLEKAMAGLDAMSPLRVLDRGYSITQTAGGRILRDAAGTSVGDALRIRLAKGEVEAAVTAKKDEIS
jgi:exodeoxyribonuclease VII large subunit